MSASIEFPAGNLYAVNVRPSRLDWIVIAELSACVIPAMATIDLARPLLGARYLVASLFVFLAIHGLRYDRYRFMSLLFGAAPALALMRGLFFYESILAFLMVGTALWAVVSWNEVRFIWRDATWRWLASLCVLYWLVSVMNIGNLTVNIRVVEFFLASAGICLLSNRRSYLATAFVGMVISTSAYAIAMLPYGVRLGEGELENGQEIGNPILLGVPAALIVLLAISDRGRYMLLEDKLLGRLVVCLAAGEWLILSGSRGGWAVTITGIVLVVLFSKQSRKPLLMAIAGLCFVTLLVLATGRGAKVNKVVDRTMNSNRSLANRTSGRSSQWEALPSIFAVSPIWGWGPGSGKDVDFIYTGRHLEFHSLYLQVIVETGVLGFVPLMCILGSLFNRAVAHLRRFGEVTPLVGIVSFLLIGLSVTAFDVLSGTILGLALMAREPNPRYVAREFAATPVDESELTTIDVGSS